MDISTNLLSYLDYTFVSRIALAYYHYNSHYYTNTIKYLINTIGMMLVSTHTCVCVFFL